MDADPSAQFCCLQVRFWIWAPLRIVGMLAVFFFNRTGQCSHASQDSSASALLTMGHALATIAVLVITLTGGWHREKNQRVKFALAEQLSPVTEAQG
jgi:hypothetical protein